VTVEVDSGPAKVVNVTLKEMECDGEDIPNKQIFIRGNGPLKLLLIGIDSSGRELLSRLANHTCPIDAGKEPALVSF
jgi:hypothetical protein